MQRQILGNEQLKWSTCCPVPLLKKAEHRRILFCRENAVEAAFMQQFNKATNWFFLQVLHCKIQLL